MTDLSCFTFSVALENVSIHLHLRGSFPQINRDQFWIQLSSKVIDRPKLKLGCGWVRLAFGEYREMCIIKNRVWYIGEGLRLLFVFHPEEETGSSRGWSRLQQKLFWSETTLWGLSGAFKQPSSIKNLASVRKMGGWVALELYRKGEAWDSCTLLVLYRRHFSIWVPKCVWVLVMGMGVVCSEMMVVMVTSEFSKRGVQIT